MIWMFSWSNKMKLRDNTPTLYHCSYFSKSLLQSQRLEDIKKYFFLSSSKKTHNNILSSSRWNTPLFCLLPGAWVFWHLALFLLPHALTRVLCLKDDNRKNLTLSYQKSIHMMSKSHKHQHQRKFDRIQRKKLSPGKIGGVETKEVKAADCSENICLFFYSLQIHHSYNKG